MTSEISTILKLLIASSQNKPCYPGQYKTAFKLWQNTYPESSKNV